MGGAEASDEAWKNIWDITVMAHIYAARAVLPQMLERGAGYLLQTASAAGLLSQIGSAPYAVTKHAAVAFAEYLSITHGDQGIKVCLQIVQNRHAFDRALAELEGCRLRLGVLCLRLGVLLRL